MQLFLPQQSLEIRLLDSWIRVKLATSLQQVIDFSRRSGFRSEVEEETLLGAIRSHRLKPGVYARYFSLVFAVKAGRWDEAKRLMTELSVMSAVAASLDVHPLTDDAMGEDATRFPELLGDTRRTRFGAPSTTEWLRFDDRVAQAFDCLHFIDPRLAAEVRGLVVEVIGAVPLEPEASFGSASSLTIWGAVIINLRVHETSLDLVEGLVHEAAHQLLFGYATKQPLVLNSAAERFTSPLRSDRRPMEGLFHATFVCARLFLLYQRLSDLRCFALLDTDAETVAQRLAINMRNYRDGARTIAAHARLSALGAQVIQSTAAFMDQAVA